MKRTLLLFVLLAAGCNPVKSVEVPDYRKYLDTTQNSGSDVDSSAMKPASDTSAAKPGELNLATCTDLVLLYGGSSHRNPADWGRNYVRDYVTYTDQSGKTHWMFDGFLLLEFMMTQFDATLVTGYQYGGKYLPSADKTVWQSLVNYYFKAGYAIDAIEESVKDATATLGAPPSKRKVVIGIPEPIKLLDSHAGTGGSTYWGELDGKTLDFSITTDRLKAVKWYINQIASKFNSKNYQYVELAGFYWVAEKATQTSDLLMSVSEYLHTLGYSFNWIPYYNADGYKQWKGYGFDVAYLQPNYFFNASIPSSRVNDACELAINANMPGMEVEFAGNAVVSSGGDKGYKLYEYIDGFKANGIWENKLLAYYQGSWAYRWLKYSSNADDQKLYYYFSDWVISRPVRESH